MIQRTFAQRLNNAKNLLGGLAAHADQLSKRGITADSITKGNQLYEQINKVQNERNALKARSQEATTQAVELMSELENFCTIAKKIIRLDFPKETWPEFGFRHGEYGGQAETEQVVIKAATTEKEK